MKTLIILHGWGRSRTDWEYFLNQAIDGYTVITIDLPGFGQESLVDATWGIPEYAKWTVAKIESFNVTDVALLGHSFGGRIASYIAAQRPPWLKSLILYATPSIYRPSGMIKARNKAAHLARRLGLKRSVSSNQELAVADQQGLGAIFRRVVSFDQTATLPQINVPTLLIWGNQDGAVPLRIAAETQCLIPDSELQVLDGLTHDAHHENPYLFYGLVKKFIERV
ncbi:MAG: alpha/beta hydrolase [Candidatus Buchananbacteria bacterium]|nr:alpha/beta hydrolase [Candidatus Buchananbacteria bacterium]